MICLFLLLTTVLIFGQIKNCLLLIEKGNLETVAGVPPDYFSATGQLWGNPLYRWKEMEKDDFLWMRNRFSQLFKMVDIVRIDHFRGFEAFWEIPGDAPTAETGKWVKAPGHKLFKSIQKHLGDVPILAEDLGVITPAVEKLRDDFEFSGNENSSVCFWNRYGNKVSYLTTLCKIVLCLQAHTIMIQPVLILKKLRQIKILIFMITYRNI